MSSVESLSRKICLTCIHLCVVPQKFVFVKHIAAVLQLTNFEGPLSSSVQPAAACL